MSSETSPTSNSTGRLFTVVIASRCDDARSKLLMRACESVRAMAAEYDYSIIVVANGPHVSSSVLDWLATKADIRVIRLRSGSYPLARRVGAEMADSEFLAFLDDDDELMPNTLAPKIAHFREHPEIDVLVTDGLRVSGSIETRIFPPPEARGADIVEAMMGAGWGAGALTLRMQNITLSAFDAEFRHLEWTLTALELASRYQVGYLDEPAYRYYEGMPNSLWKSAEHSFAAPEVWRRLLKSYAGTRYAAMVRQRCARVCHSASDDYAREGRIREAWRLHFMSLRSLGGMVYLPFSARLVFASVRRLFARSASGQRVGVRAIDRENST